MIPPSFTPSRARIEAGRLIFDRPDAMALAFSDGCFALKIPDGFDTTPGVRLAREFYRDAGASPNTTTAAYQGFRDKPDVYFDREHFQTEHILADEAQRRALFPNAVNLMCGAMAELGRVVLREILTSAGVPQELWRRITDAATEGGGVQWFAVSHYRPDRAQLGAPAHKDTGFVTVLYCDQPGLEARMGGEWRSIDPVDGHFIINFGGALEILTADLPARAAAVLHRVRRCYPAPGREDRFSFAAFLNPSAAGHLYRLSENAQDAHPAVSVEAFLRDFNQETWGDTHTDFGILLAQAPPTVEAGEVGRATE